MHYPGLCERYSRFHGSVSFRTEQSIIITDYAALEFDAFSITSLMYFDKIHMDARLPFVEAAKILNKSEDPATVFCVNQTAKILMGNTKLIVPSTEEMATFQKYATPYFVEDPASIAEFLQGMAHSTHDNIFIYKHCILYLDGNDLPSPGGCYFDSSSSHTLYRICLLSQEDQSRVIPIASEWKDRRDVLTLPFLTKETIATPGIISFQPVAQPYLPDSRAVVTGPIQKRLSMHDPYCLIQDIIASYARNSNNLTNLGLIVEWPFRLAYEGSRPNASSEKEFVALAVNGVRPNHTLFVRYPYEVYTEYDEVPVTRWTVLQYSPVLLQLPLEAVKVSVDSVVIGYVYKKAFYCFSYPVLEGRPTHESSRNMEFLFSPVKQLDSALMETFRINEKYAINRVQTKDVPLHAWCITQTEETHKYSQQKHLPPLVDAWLNLFVSNLDAGKKQFVDVKMMQMALTLARHKICFSVKTSKKKSDQIYMSDQDISIAMSQPEAEFINNMRVYDTEEEAPSVQQEEDNGCTIM